MVEYRVKRVLVEGRDYDRFAALVPSGRFYRRVRLYHADAPTYQPVEKCANCGASAEQFVMA